MYSKRLYNRGGRRYGISMNISHTMPGTVSLAHHTLNLSKEARRRLKWFDYYHKSGNISLTCRYFGISRETFYYWKRRYNPYHLKTLESRSCRPKNTRGWEVKRQQELQVVSLHKKRIRYIKGDSPLKLDAGNLHPERISERFF